LTFRDFLTHNGQIIKSFLEETKMKSLVFSAIVLTGIVLFAPLAIAVERNVPGEYATIQAAINASSNGDVVIIAPGTYTGTGNKDLDFAGKAITVKSTNPDDSSVVAATVIDCENSGRGFCFYSGESSNSIVSGITIKRGRVSNQGAGIYCSGSSPTIKNCVITESCAFGSYGNPNGGSAYGGGVYCTLNSHLTLIDCTVSNNNAQGGTGSDEWCSPMSGCSGSLGKGGDAYGGGIFCSSDSSITVTGCIITNNSVLGGQGGIYYETGSPEGGEMGGMAYGGGIYSASAAVINNCRIVSNTATGGNGGYNSAFGNGLGGGISADGTITNCLIADNLANEGSGGPPRENQEGGGILTDDSYISNCTITGNICVANYGSGIQGTSSTVIVNCIIWNNSDDDLYNCSATYSCISNTDDGTGVIHSNPCFVSGPLGNYYLRQIAAGQSSNSPCVDAGSDTSKNLGMSAYTTRTDKIADMGIVDMGYHYPAKFYPDLNGDAFVNFIDFAIFANDWQQTSDPCNPKSGDIYKDGQVDIYDLALLVNDWCLTVEIEPNLPFSGLVGWWTFDEGSGTIANDSITGNNGDIYGGQWATGKVGDHALDITPDSYVEIPDNDLLTPADEMTLAFWAYNRGYIFLSKNSWGDEAYWPSNVNSYYVIVGGDFNAATLVVYSSATANDGVSSTNEAVPLNEWHHIAMTFNRGEVKVFIDGVLNNSGTVTATPIINDDLPLIIGGNRFYYFEEMFVVNTLMDGIIDDLRIYNRELEQQEVQALYQLGQ